MKKRAEIILLTLICICLASGCVSSGQGQSLQRGEESPETLNVYIVSHAVHSYSQQENNEEVYYTTMMSLGDFTAATAPGSEGFLFYHAFEEYQKQTGITLNVRWFEYPELMEEELMQLDEAQRPDVILTNFTSRNDYYQYMRDGMFYDLTDWFEQEAMYTDGQYYNAVLQAGQYKERQYIVPILFNISTIMGAGRIWNELGLHPEAAQDYEDILDALIYVQADQKIDQTACQFVEASPEYLPCILYSASGEQWIDYEKEAVHLDETVFRKMCIFYQYFVKEQLSEEDIIQGETLHWTNAKNLRIIRSICNEIQLNAFLGDMGCIVEGGGGFQPCLHSAAAQA